MTQEAPNNSITTSCSKNVPGIKNPNLKRKRKVPNSNFIGTQKIAPYFFFFFFRYTKRDLLVYTYSFKTSYINEFFLTELQKKKERKNSIGVLCTFNKTCSMFRTFEESYLECAKQILTHHE